MTYRVLKNDILSKFPKLTFEIIFIDDGSKDGSFKEMCEVKALDNGIKLNWGMHLKHIDFLSNIGGYENPQKSNRI